MEAFQNCKLRRITRVFVIFESILSLLTLLLALGILVVSLWYEHDEEKKRLTQTQLIWFRIFFATLASFALFKLEVEIQFLKTTYMNSRDITQARHWASVARNVLMVLAFLTHFLLVALILQGNAQASFVCTLVFIYRVVSLIAVWKFVGKIDVAIRVGEANKNEMKNVV